MTGYLRVRNWEKFQHYKNRRPPWVRYHVEMLDDHELLSFNYGTQLIYDRLLLLAARTDNNIPNDQKWISGQTLVDQDTTAAALESLLDAGFLSIAETKRAASTVIARRKQRASDLHQKEAPEADSSEAEAETEAEDPEADLPEKIERLAVDVPSFGVKPAGAQPGDEPATNGTAHPDFDIGETVRIELAKAANL